MDAASLRQTQQPLKERYQQDPSAAQVTLSAAGDILIDQLKCRVEPLSQGTTAGLHPAAGGDGSGACSGDMMLQALVACSGVTFAAVATAMSLQVSFARVQALGTMDMRGTLGISRDAGVGLQEITLSFELESASSDAQLQKLIELTERYCVVLQSLAVPVHSRWNRRSVA